MALQDIQIGNSGQQLVNRWNANVVTLQTHVDNTNLHTPADITIVPNWAASSFYALNTLTVHNNTLFRATTAHTSGATFNTANWQAVGGGASIVPTTEYVRNTAYTQGYFTFLGNRLFRITTDFTSANLATVDASLDSDITAGWLVEVSGDSIADAADLISSDLRNALIVGSDDLLFVPSPRPSPPVSGTYEQRIPLTFTNTSNNRINFNPTPNATEPPPTPSILNTAFFTASSQFIFADIDLTAIVQGEARNIRISQEMTIWAAQANWTSRPSWEIAPGLYMRFASHSGEVAVSFFVNPAAANTNLLPTSVVVRHAVIYTDFVKDTSGSDNIDHADLDNLGFTESGHTGFASQNGLDTANTRIDNLIASGGGITDHNELNNLGFTASGHTGFSPDNHTHVRANITDFAHTHPQADVTGLGTALTTVNTSITTINTALADRYTKAEIATIIGQIQTAQIEVVATLPATGNTNIIYLVSRASGNVKDMYIWFSGAFVSIGDTEIDLSNYSTTAQMNTAIQNAVTAAINALRTELQGDITQVGTDLTSHATNNDIHTSTAERNTFNAKQDAIIAGTNITIAPDGRTISSSGGLSQADLDSAVSNLLPLTGGTINGNLTITGTTNVPTRPINDDSNNIANTAFVQAIVDQLILLKFQVYKGSWEDFIDEHPTGVPGERWAIVTNGILIAALWNDTLSDWSRTDATTIEDYGLWRPELITTDEGVKVGFTRSHETTPITPVLIPRGERGMQGRVGSGKGRAIGEVFEHLFWTENIIDDGDGVYARLNGDTLPPEYLDDLILSLGDKGVLAYMPMTSNTAPTPQAVSSSPAGAASWPVWRAFSLRQDELPTSGFLPTTILTSTAWLQIDIGLQVKVERYILRTLNSNVSDMQQTPRDWQLQASNDGMTWDILDNVIDNPQGPPMAGVIYANRILNEIANYRFYRLYVTRWYGSRFGIGAFHLISSSALSFFRLPNVAPIGRFPYSGNMYMKIADKLPDNP